MDKSVAFGLALLAGIAGYFAGNHGADTECKNNLAKAVKMNYALQAQSAFKDCD